MTTTDPAGRTDHDDPTPPRVAALRRAAQQRTTKAEAAADKSIRRLLKDGGQISFAAVARGSGVSKSFLHSHPALSQRIRDLGNQQHEAAHTAHEATATGESAIIAALRRHITDLEERHKEEVRVLRAKVRDQERQIALLYGQLPVQSTTATRRP